MRSFLLQGKPLCLCFHDTSNPLQPEPMASHLFLRTQAHVKAHTARGAAGAAVDQARGDAQAQPPPPPEPELPALHSAARAGDAAKVLHAGLWCSAVLFPWTRWEPERIWEQPG